MSWPFGVTPNEISVPPVGTYTHSAGCPSPNLMKLGAPQISLRSFRELHRDTFSHAPLFISRGAPRLGAARSNPGCLPQKPPHGPQHPATRAAKATIVTLMSACRSGSAKLAQVRTRVAVSDACHAARDPASPVGSCRQFQHRIAMTASGVCPDGHTSETATRVRTYTDCFRLVRSRIRGRRTGNPAIRKLIAATGSTRSDHPHKTSMLDTSIRI